MLDIKSWKAAVWMSVAISVLSGCATQGSVFTDHDRNHSFSSYRTFSWIGDDPIVLAGDRGPSALTADQIKSSVVASLAGKGFEFVDRREDADFVLSISVGARDRIDVRERQVVDYYGDHWRWGYQHFLWMRPPPNVRTEVVTRNYTEGSLSIDVFDGANKSPVWHGHATKRLSKEELQGSNRVSIQSAVDTILADFPPK